MSTALTAREPYTVSKDTVYGIVTEKILAQLDAGTVPWRQTWILGLPRNGVTDRPYNGINFFLLYLQAQANGWDDLRFLTKKQIRERGGFIRRGEHGNLIIFVKTYRKRTGPGDDDFESRGILRYYYVWNLAQCDNVTLPHRRRSAPESLSPVGKAETIISDYRNGPAIAFGPYHPPHYIPHLDEVRTPPMRDFTVVDEFYATLFHELAHSTGHEFRLDRLENKLYAQALEHRGKEELVAEFGAAFLCAYAGVSNALDNSAAYIRHWRDAIAADPKLVVQAASAGQRACAYILSAGIPAGEEAFDSDSEEA